MQYNKYNITALTDEKRTNFLITRICLWATLSFVIILFLTLPLIGIFSLNSAKTVVIWASIGSICTFSPYILREFELKPAIIKYYTIAMLNLYLCILASFKEPYPILVFLFPAVLSCLYCRRKVTLIAVSIGLMCNIYSKYSYSKVLHKLTYVGGDFKLGMISSIIQYVILCGLLVLLSSIAENIIEAQKIGNGVNSPLQDSGVKGGKAFYRLMTGFVTTGVVTKYIIVTLCTIYIGLLRSYPPINADIIYLFPLLLSCLYFDKRLVIYCFVLSIINITVSEYFHTLLRGQITSRYYTPRVISYLLEFAIVSLPVLFMAFRNSISVKILNTKDCRALKS